MINYSIKKDDQVMVIAGKEKGKTSRVVRVQPAKGAALVEKLNMVKRHTKPSTKHRHGGIIEKEAPIDISNLMIICRKCTKPVRTGKKLLENGSRVRFCKNCGEVID
ncbi:MAG: 50S ribosomal protein L24 [Deltaproteobacteria bacterium]|nr:50S ribosomal protein L24 [Deltaproteobacteria bacterium]